MPFQAWADQLARGSIALYDSLPKHGKPTIRSNGVPEWTILAVISLVIQQQEEGTSPWIEPISLGTGAKCLPANKLPPLGDTLHDCHAEVLARRGLVRWLLEEGKRVVARDDHLDVLEIEAGQFRFKPGVQVWMYVSALPCGDASTLHTALHQPADMAALKDGPRPTTGASPGSFTESSGAGAGTVRGRNGYANFSAIRTKPGRADSVPSISMSCSDKIATWSVLGLQGALLSGLFAPAKLSGIVVGGVEPPADFADRPAEFEAMIMREAERALCGRLQPIEDRLVGPYSLSLPKVHFTTVRFKHHKSDVSASFASGPEPSTSPTSISFIRSVTGSSSISVDVIFNGSKLGTNWKAPGEVVLAPRGRPKVCKLQLLKAYDALRSVLSSVQPIAVLMPEQTYYELKHPSGSAYQRAKEVLRGEVLAEQDLPAFSRCGRFATTGRTTPEERQAGNPDEDSVPPFSGWIVSGHRWENFTSDGQLRRGDTLASEHL